MPGPPTRNAAVIGTIAGFFALAATQMYTISHLNAVQSSLADVEAELAKSKDMLSVELDKARSKVQSDVSERQKSLDAVRQEVEAARNQAKNIAGTVKKETLKGVEDLNARVNANEQKLRDTHAALTTELNGVKETATTANSTLAAVSTEVAGIKDDVSATRNQLNSAIADLKRVNGDMGVMSGLIATNQHELEALREYGDRNYADFTLMKTKDPVRVGDVWLLLKKSDSGNNRYTIEVRADDRRIEKKDRGVNEPVQFYVGHNRQPHELVVNRIQKNGIVGYLATPKVTRAAK